MIQRCLRLPPPSWLRQPLLLAPVLDSALQTLAQRIEQAPSATVLAFALQQLATPMVAAALTARFQLPQQLSQPGRGG